MYVYFIYLYMFTFDMFEHPSISAKRCPQHTQSTFSRLYTPRLDVAHIFELFKDQIPLFVEIKWTTGGDQSADTRGVAASLLI